MQPLSGWEPGKPVPTRRRKENEAIIETAAVDEPAIVRLAKQFASRLEEEASEWPESAAPLAWQLVPTANIAAEELQRGYWSEQPEVLGHACSESLKAMASIERLLERAMAERLLSAERHWRLEGRVCQLRALLRYVLKELEQGSGDCTD